MAVASSSFQPSRIGFGSISGAPRPAGPDREVEASGAAGVGPADAAEHGAADHVRALAKAVQAHLGRVEPERPREVGVEGLESVLLAQLRLRHLLEAAGVAGARVVRVGEQALLYRQRGDGAGARGGVAVAGGVDRAGCPRRPARWARGPPRRRARAGRARRGARPPVGPRHGVEARHGAEVRVRVAVAVHVLQDHVAAQLPALARLLDHAVVHRHHGRAEAREDADAAAAVARLHEVGGVLARLRALEEVALRDVVGVACAGVDGEAAFGEAGERADEVGGHAGDQPGPQQHRVDVPVGVVVGEHRAATSSS